MTPYYSDDLVTIYHGDCREVMPEADVVLTDPPYGVSKAKWDDDIPDMAWLDRARSFASIVAFTPGLRPLFRYPSPDWIIAWARPASTQANGLGGINNWEPVLVYGRRPLRTDLVTLSHPGRTNETGDHPTPKPLDLYRRLAELLSRPGETILDPFMGSGTTLVAAKSLGRKAIGIEIEERYCEIAATRCSQEVLGLAV